MQRVILILLFYFPLFAFSQQNASYFSSYFEKMNNKLNLKYEIDNDIESYKYGNNKNGYTIEPNTNYRNTISVNYRYITLKVGFSPKYLANENTDIKGKTNTFKLQSDIYIQNWIQTFEYQKISGYHVTNIFNSDSDISSDFDEIIILPHLKTKSISGITRYKFNPDFSLKALLNQQEIQTKSAGSFVPSFTWNYFEIYDKSSVQDVSSFSMIFSAGYFYTYVLNEKWYATLGLSPGLGLGFNKLILKSENEEITTKNNDIVFNINAHLGIGYNSKSFFGGLALRATGTSRDNSSIVEFDTLRGIFQIFIGYRFKTPKFVEEGMDWLEQENPLF